MAKKIDELAMDLASGMSRRKAFWRFAAAVAGGALVGAKRVLGAPPAPPGPNHATLCELFCRLQLLEGADYDACIQASAACPDGECAVIGNAGPICVPVAS